MITATEDIVDAEIVDDEESAGGTATLTERTVVFFTDPRAATLLLTETIGRLISTLRIKHGIVDLSSIPGLAVAAAFERAGVPYESLLFGQENHYDNRPPERDAVNNPYIESDAERFRRLAAGSKVVPMADLGTINANIVLIPAMVGPDEKLIDLSFDSLPGAVLTQLEAVERAFVIVDTPERGLRSMPDGTYERTLIQVSGPLSKA
ncbi:hypothetical protein [Cryobacterium zhongshanensis]|uniref:Uncharacterized protein n=1 Tax=Cryobacterium zhongshanensis TaxID=2928153 RepID=A0AA41UHA0_9MICO|nr:hypothetical protein [Cryobacterium zhongshanensis]MCI4659690.1 hypothetical protein [Cryobacterium zhongshanensis]